MTKFTRLRDFPLLESALFVLMSYSSFLIAEVADLTGRCFLRKSRWRPSSYQFKNIVQCADNMPVLFAVRYRSCSCSVLRYMSSALHLQQPVARFETSNEAPLRIVEFLSRKFHIFLHRCVDVHVSETSFRPRIHFIRICILFSRVISGPKCRTWCYVLV